MNDFPGRIEAIEKKLKRFEQLLAITEKEVDSLIQESKIDKEKIKAKEQELEEWRKKLEECQQEKINMQKELKSQIAELKKNGKLSNGQKQFKLLLIEQSKELERVEQYLYNERTHYRKIRDKLINKLLEPCEICPEKERLINTLEDRFKKLSVWSCLILLSSVFHFFLFLFMVFRRKQKVRKPFKSN